MATIASLVVSIGADIAQLKTGVDQANTKIDSFANKATTAFRALTSAAAFGVVVQGIRQIVDAASEIDTLSARINDTAEAVQRLQAVSADFDVEMSAITAGIQTMQERLGDGKLDNALSAINLQVEQFRSLSPSEQFIAAAEALARIEDPAERGAKAADIFGKNAKGLAGAFREGVRDADAWVAMSGSTVSSIDRIATAFWKAKDAVLAFAANLIQARTIYSKFEFNMPDLPKSPAPGVPSAPGLPKDYDEINKSLTEIAEKSIKVQTAQAKIAEAAKRASESFRETVNYFNIADNMGTTFRQSLDDSADEIAEIREEAERLAATFPFLTGEWGQLKKGVEDTKPAMQALAIEAERVAQRLLTWRGVGQQLSGAIMGAIQGGGSVGKALGGSAGQMLGTKLGDTVGNWAGKAIGGSLGAAIGGAAGSVLPVVGTMLGSLAGSFIGKMFGGGNQDRKQIQTAMQGLDFVNLTAKANELGISMDRVFSAKKVNDFQSAVAGVTAQINEQEQLHQRGIAAMERYGITIEQAGAKFKQTQMNTSAQSLVEDFHALVAVGVDTDTIIEKMGGSVGDFIHRSIEMGTTVPREMQGIIAKMIETGSLVDKNGEKFTDLGQIPWAEGPNAAMQKLIDKIGQLIDLISLGIPDALNRLPRETRLGVTLDVDASALDDYSIDGRFPKLAAGGIVTQPTVAMIGEAGPEAVVPLSRLGNGGRGGGETHVHIHGGVFDGYTSEVSFARRVLDVLSQERERRGRGLAFGAA